jgi:hypothetical protein
VRSAGRDNSILRRNGFVPNLKKECTAFGVQNEKAFKRRDISNGNEITAFHRNNH